MTIFRVDIEKDIATLANKGTRVKDKELEKALSTLNRISEVRKALSDLQQMSNYYVKQAREVYTICDNRLKAKDLSKDDKGELAHIRKVAYDFTMQLKKLGFV